MTDNLMLYMVTQEKRGSPEAEVTYFASITYHLQKKKTKKKTINRSLSQPFCLITRWEGLVRDKTKRLHGGPTPYEFGQLLCRHERCLPTKKLKQRYVTKKKKNKNKQTTTTAAHKGERIRLTCLHLI